MTTIGGYAILNKKEIIIKTQLTENDIKRIRDKATQLYMEMPHQVFWKMHDEIHEKDRRVIAYVDAVMHILELDYEVRYHKKRGQK